MKNGLDEQYIDLLTDILENGVEKNTRKRILKDIIKVNMLVKPNY